MSALALALLLLVALIVSHLGLFLPVAQAATPVFRVFAAYERGHGEQQLTFLKGDGTDPFGHTSPQPCGSGKVVFEMSAHAEVLDISTGTITELPAGAYWPRCNPQGTQIAFTGGPNKTLWIMNVNGSNPHQVSPTANAYRPVWDSSGTRLAFDVFGNGIKVVGADGTGEAQVTNTGAHPSFGPSNSLAFEDTDYGISSYNFATASVTKLLGGFATMPAREPTWSFDGTKLAYSIVYSGTVPPNSTRQEIWVYDTTNNSNTRWTAGLQPAWSVDGGFFTFVHESNQTSAGPGVGISFGGSAVEGGNLPIIIRRFGDLNVQINLTIRFESGTATGSTTPNSMDFNASAIPFQLGVGQQQLVIMFPTNDDNEYEPGANETFLAYIGQVVGGHIEGSGEAQGQITDNELPPSTIVSPPVSSTQPVYSAQAQTAFELSVPENPDENVHISVARGNQVVFERDQPASTLIVGAAAMTADAEPAVANVRICVWGSLTTSGCPVMPNSLLKFDQAVSYTITLTYMDKEATRSFSTEYKMQYVFLPAVRA